MSNKHRECIGNGDNTPVVEQELSEPHEEEHARDAPEATPNVLPCVASPNPMSGGENTVPAVHPKARVVETAPALPAEARVASSQSTSDVVTVQCPDDALPRVPSPHNVGEMTETAPATPPETDVAPPQSTSDAVTVQCPDDARTHVLTPHDVGGITETAPATPHETDAASSTDDLLTIQHSDDARPHVPSSPNAGEMSDAIPRATSHLSKHPDYELTSDSEHVNTPEVPQRAAVLELPTTFPQTSRDRSSGPNKRVPENQPTLSPRKRRAVKVTERGQDLG